MEEIISQELEKLSNKIQRSYDKSIFKTKTPHDKLTCRLCGGKYTRHKKSLHDKTKKHLSQLDKLNQLVKVFFYDVLDNRKWVVKTINLTPEPKYSPTPEELYRYKNKIY